MLNPSRLISARKRRRLTSKVLAERIGVSPVTISRLEKGKNPPDPETLRAIAKELGFPIEFFNEPDIEEASRDAVSFRSLTSITALEREAALSAASIAYLISDWVEKKFHLPPADLLDLGTERIPEAAANSLRQYWGLGEHAITNMVKLLESKGVRVFSLVENTKNVDAFSCWRRGVPYIFLNTFKSAEHSRFDAAHELAHLVLHKHGGPRQDRRAEYEANEFASAFLMPQADLRARVPYLLSLDQLVMAKRHWGVSAAALAYRLQKLGIISEWHHRMFCIEMSKRGYRTKEPNEMKRETSVVWKKILSQLWQEKTTKAHIAAELKLPQNEVEDLLFGLVGSLSGKETVFNEVSRGVRSLKLIS